MVCFNSSGGFRGYISASEAAQFGIRVTRPPVPKKERFLEESLVAESERLVRRALKVARAAYKKPIEIVDIEEGGDE